METDGASEIDELPDDPESVHMAARDLVKARRHREAVALCERAEAAGVYNAGVAAAHSAALLKMRRTEDAIALLHGMLYYFPNEARLHLNLGTAYSAVYRRREAGYEYDLAKRLDPAVGREVTRLMILRLSLFLIAFATFFATVALWPRTRWLLVGLDVVMLAMSVYLLIGAIRSSGFKRILAPVGMIVFWVVVLILALYPPSRW